MANVNIKFNGKDFLLSCEDGQEDHLEELAANLNDKFEKLKNFNFKNPDVKKLVENLNIQKNQLEIEKQELEEKYKSLSSDYGNLTKKLDEFENKEKTEKKKQIEFSEKIDELNQETDTLLDEIDKWQT